MGPVALLRKSERNDLLLLRTRNGNAVFSYNSRYVKWLAHRTMKITKAKAKRLILGTIPEMEKYIHLIRWSDTKDELFAGLPREVPNELVQKVVQLLSKAQQ